MGINYYWREEEYKTCEHCGHGHVAGFAEKRIGKSSVGWTFGLHVYPVEEINTLEDWINIWCTKKGHIRDEYGAGVTIVEMLRIIMCRNGRDGSASSVPNECWYTMNYTQPGPMGLVQRIGSLVIGYGENNGTWDYCVGDFS